mmetsp:Transcript_4335/g.6468  ORF Transcript_4335/g.6468 Transcript_4335/m.6468 type:complete len:81 (+) Transcript_4335:128-370(+)
MPDAPVTQRHHGVLQLSGMLAPIPADAPTRTSSTARGTNPFPSALTTSRRGRWQQLVRHRRGQWRHTPSVRQVACAMDRS